MKQQILKVKSNIKIARDIYRISLAGDCSGIKGPGQFVNILIDGLFLRRPFSIFDYDDSHIEILYRVVGKGTEALAAKRTNDKLDVLLPLGNGFDVEKRGKKSLLVAGGIGMPPIYGLAKQLRALQKKNSDNSTSCDFRVLLGFRSAREMFGTNRFWDIGVEPVIATEDGVCGIHGNVVSAMKLMKASAGLISCGNDLAYDFDYVFCCGPEPMLKAVYDMADSLGVHSGQFSFEERMGCGFGACMGCSCKTKYGYKRICKDGPILDIDEIVW